MKNLIEFCQLPNPEKEETRTYNFENIEDEDDI